MSPAASLAAGDSDPRRALAERLAGEGRCAAAVDVATELRAEGRSDADLLLLAGTCEVQLRRYEEAAATLREALALAPDHAKARLRLAIALFHLDDPAAARAELDVAEPDLPPDDAELLLYRGLLLLEDARHADAAELLERARARDPGTVEPVASFYAGTAWARERDRERALVHFERVEREWPGTSWAAEAARMRQQLEAARLRRWARVRAGFEYDDNAVLQGGGAPLPSEISSRGDQRGVWSLEAGAEWLRSERWSGGVLAAYGGSAYEEITSFDSHYPTGAIWLDRRLDDATTLRLLVDGGFAWVDLDSFLSTQRASVSLLRAWSEAGFTELYGRVRRDDYRVGSDDVPDGNGTPGAPCILPPAPPLLFCGPPGIDERRERDRDGWAWIGGLRHSLELPSARSTLRMGYEFERFNARGSEYGYDAHSVSAGLLLSLPFELTLDLAGVFTWRPYEAPTTFPNPPGPFFNQEYGLEGGDRRERFYAVGIGLARPLAGGVTASASWRHERNHSTAEVFDYDRQVFGLYLTWAIGH